MKLHNKQSYITKQNEEFKKRKRLPLLTKIIYYLVLMSIVAYLVYFFVSRAYSFSSTGYVMSEREDLVASYGGRVIAMSVRPGDSVKRGDEIARIAASKFCQIDENRALQDTKEDLIRKQLEFAHLRNELELIKNEFKRYKKQTELSRALDLDAPLISENKMDNLQLDENKKNLELALAREEVKYLTAKQEKLLGLPKPRMSPECSEELVRAPYQGTIFSTLVNENDIVSKDEPIVQMYSPNFGTHVYTQVEFEEYQNVNIGKPLDILLPDGKKTRGIVEDIGAKYEETLPLGLGTTKNAFIVVKIKPSSDTTQGEWAQFDDYQVKVIGTK